MSQPNQKIITAILVMFMSVAGYAQNGVGGGQGPPPPQGLATPPPGLPLDNGLVLLFAGAFIYGIYVILKKSPKKQT